MRQHCRDNVTLFSGQKKVEYLSISICLYELRLLHLDIEALTFLYFFLSLKLYNVVPLFLPQSYNNFRVPSSANKVNPGGGRVHCVQYTKTTLE